MSEKLIFIASLPPIQSAITLGGQHGDGARIKLDVPGSDMKAVMALQLAFCERPFKVTIEAVDE